jgi:hypothetical protein
MGPAPWLLAADEAPQWLNLVARPDVLFPLIPIVAIVGGTALGITKLILRHRERIVKIQHGIDPDAPRSMPPDGR